MFAVGLRPEWDWPLENVWFGVSWKRPDVCGGIETVSSLHQNKNRNHSGVGKDLMFAVGLRRDIDRLEDSQSYVQVGKDLMFAVGLRQYQVRSKTGNSLSRSHF